LEAGSKVKSLKTSGRDPAFMKLPERTLYGHYKSLAKEFVPRGVHTAKNISASSTLKFDWDCVVCGERIKGVSVMSRTRAIDEGRETRGCYVCADRGPIVQGDAEPLPQWLKDECVEEKGLTPPQKLMTDTRELRLWCCGACKFLFRASVAVRNATKDRQDCPGCTNFGDDIVDLTDKAHTRLAKMFMKGPRNAGYIKLRKMLPLKHKVHWKCGQGHVRYASFKQVFAKRGCLTCYTAKHKSETLASSTYKELADQFASVVGRETFEPQDVPAKSNTLIVEWHCQRSEFHRWRLAPGRRTSKVPFAGCPYCFRRRVAVEESLVKTHKSIAMEWDFDDGNKHPSKNRKITPDEVLATDRKKYDWVCLQGHGYKASCKARTERRVGCPLCLVLPNCLANTHPKVAAEWHTKLNEDSGLTPKNVSAGSMKKVHWRCRQVKKHCWKAVIYRRANEGTGCPHCARQTLIKANTLQGAYPKLVHYYHLELNRQAANAAPAGLNQIYWWYCRTCSNSYKRKVRSMLEGGFECLSCRARQRIRQKSPAG
jgi:hypothetical protein